MKCRDITTLDKIADILNVRSTWRADINAAYDSNFVKIVMNDFFKVPADMAEVFIYIYI